MPESNPPRIELKKALYRLCVARSDLLSARTTATLLRETVEGIPYPDYLGHELFFPLLQASAIAYGRPFSRNTPLGRIPSNFARFSEPELSTTHELLLELRNKFVAHSDQLLRDVEIIPPGYRITPDTPPSVGFGTSVRNRGISLEQLKNIEVVANEVGRRVDAAVREQGDILPRQSRGHPGEPLKAVMDGDASRPLVPPFRGPDQPNFSWSWR